MISSIQTAQDLEVEIETKDINEIKGIYREQCPAIFNKELEKDNGLLYMLALQKKNGFDLLQQLLTTYDIWRTKNMHRIDISPVRQWVKEDKPFDSMGNISIELPDGTVQDFKKVLLMAVQSYGILISILYKYCYVIEITA